MNLAIRPELKTLLKRSAALLPIPSLLAQSCSFDSRASAYREIEGCIIKEDPVKDIPDQPPRSTLHFREPFRTLKVTVLNQDAKLQEAQFDAGDYIRLEFTNIDTSLIPTGRDSRRKELERELDDIINKSTSFVIMVSSKVSISAVLLQKTSPHCTG